MDGFHEMLANMLSAIIVDPKESLNHNVCLAFLGTTSDILKDKCQWSNEAYALAIRAYQEKKATIGGGPDSFIHKFYDKKNKKYGPYLRLVLQDMANLDLDTTSFEHAVTSSLLDVSHRYFNHSDSYIAIIASELADLHNDEKGMSNFDAFTEASLR